jgi:hypothetical protein
MGRNRAKVRHFIKKKKKNSKESIFGLMDAFMKVNGTITKSLELYSHLMF